MSDDLREFSGSDSKPTLIKHPSMSDNFKSPNSYLTISNTVFQGHLDGSSQGSPKAYFDENNRKVVIIAAVSNESGSKSNENDGGTSGNKATQMSAQKIQHCIEWEEDTDPKVIEKAIEDVLEKVKTTSKTTITHKKDPLSGY